MDANDERWMVRFEGLEQCIAQTGRFPRRSVEAERSLNLWMNDQRRFFRAGTLAAHREAKLREIPGVLLSSRKDRLTELAEFHELHGRLPRTTAKDLAEAKLATYLVQGLRTSIRRGTISAHRLERAKKIPGATNIRIVPDQDGMLERLCAWVGEHGEMPLNSVSAGPDETRLADWARNTCAGDPDTKTARRRERHLAVLNLQASLPPRIPAAVKHLDSIETFCTDRGYLPRGTGEEKRMCSHFGELVRLSDEGRLDRFTAERVRRVLRYPSWSDYQWEASLKALKSFAATRGTMPTGPSQGRIYTWLTTQRRSWRRGTMPERRVEMLTQVRGALPSEAPRLVA